ncbi:MAG: tetratricopeptide repeat protein [Planctomycetota bacterium]
MKLVLALLSIPLAAGLWWTPDQEGRRAFERGEFARAAEAFEDPLWEGAAWYRAGEFERAAAAFARRDVPEAHYDRANALVFLGRYDDAIESYDRALARRPGWKEAEENRALAAARRDALDFEGGDMTGGELGADEIVFDDGKKGTGESVEVAGGDALSDDEIQALWLRRVRSSPADFLQRKFALQASREEDR